MVYLDADLTVTAPNGGHLHLSADGGPLLVDCDSGETLWYALQAVRTTGFNPRPRRLRDLRNQLKTSIHLLVNGEDVLHWAPGEFPRVRSWRRFAGLLRSRRGLRD